MKPKANSEMGISASSPRPCGAEALKRTAYIERHIHVPAAAGVALVLTVCNRGSAGCEGWHERGGLKPTDQNRPRTNVGLAPTRCSTRSVSIGAHVGVVTRASEKLDVDERREQRFRCDRVEAPESLCLLLRQTQAGDLEILGAYELEHCAYSNEWSVPCIPV